MPDLINRYISNILTIDQIETITNKSIDGDFNTISDIDHTSLKKITDKGKLHDNIVYNDDPTTQAIEDHENIDLDGLIDGDVLQYDGTLEKWVNANLDIPTDVGDIKFASNVGSSGVGVFFQKVVDTLQFAKLKSNNTELTIAANSNVIEFAITSASDTGKGIVEIATSAESSGTLVVASNDTRLTDARTPLAHATSHKSGQTDVIKLDELGAPTDITTLNATSSVHGLLPKLPADTTKYLRGDGTWQVPTLSGVSTRVYDRSFSTVDIVLTAVKTTLYSVTVIGGDLGTNGILEVEIFGTYFNNSGASRTLECYIEFGGVIQWQCTTASIPADGSERPFIAKIRLINKNSASSQEIYATITMADATDPTVGIGNIDNDDIQTYSPVSNTAAANINTASNQSLVFAIKHETSHASLRMRKRSAFTKIS